MQHRELWLRPKGSQQTKTWKQLLWHTTLRYKSVCLVWLKNWNEMLEHTFNRLQTTATKKLHEVKAGRMPANGTWMPKLLPRLNANNAKKVELRLQPKKTKTKRIGKSKRSKQKIGRKRPKRKVQKGKGNDNWHMTISTHNPKCDSLQRNLSFV